MNEKVLPLADPFIKTYQGSAFVLGVLTAEDRTKDICYNNYINLTCKNVADVHGIEMGFVNEEWEYYRVKGIAEMDLYHFRTFNETHLIEFLKERIDQDNYILLYSIDDYYLSYSKNYQIKHDVHDTYIYGYEEDAFLVMAYSDRTLSKVKVPMKEIVDGLFSEENYGSSFCSFRLSHVAKVEYDLRTIYRELRNYAESKAEEEESHKKYGLRVYDGLIDLVMKEIERCNDEETISENADKKQQFDYMVNGVFDIRPFRVLWEHKSLMTQRVKRMSVDVAVGEEIVCQTEGLEQDGRTIFMLMVKYCVSGNCGILRRVIELLGEIREKEKGMIQMLLAVMEKELDEKGEIRNETL
ncbi:MAG: hypothetical protein J6J38_05460 [Lachnospiraceae bacterium]|nr:hypothetical protein [Lachnospiraceae bacterium]